MFVYCHDFNDLSLFMNRIKNWRKIKICFVNKLTAEIKNNNIEQI